MQYISENTHEIQIVSHYKNVPICALEIPENICHLSIDGLTKPSNIHKIMKNIPISHKKKAFENVFFFFFWKRFEIWWLKIDQMDFPLFPLIKKNLFEDVPIDELQSKIDRQIETVLFPIN